jgi:hypothetical protein
MAIYGVKTRFIFTGTFFIKTGSKIEAKRLVEENCGLVLGGGPHSSLPSSDVDWDFPVRPEKETGRAVPAKKEVTAMVDFETITILERLAVVNGPLMRLLKERRPTRDEADKQYLEAVERVQKITQEVLNLITEGLL